MSFDYKRDRVAEEVKRMQKKISDLGFDKTRLDRKEQVEIDKVRSEFKTRRGRIETEKANLNAEIRLKEKQLDRMDKEFEANNPTTLTPSEKARLARKEKQRLY